MEQELDNVILEAYGLRGRNDETARRAAHAWLNDFANKSEAWDLCFQKLGSESAEVQFFCSNILYTKVKKESELLPDELKKKLYTTVQGLIQSYVQESNTKISKRAVQRLCLMLAQLVKKFPVYVESYINECNILLDMNPGGQRGIFIVAELLVALPEECDVNNVIHSLNPDGIGRALMDSIPATIVIIRRILAINETECQTKALECLQRWADVGLDVQRLDHYQLLDPILGVLLQGNYDSDLLDAACRAITACVVRQQDSTIQAFDRIMNALLGAVVHLARSDNESDSLAMCLLCVSVAENQVEKLVTNSEYMGFVNLVMQFTNHPSRNVSIHTLNFWLLVQDIPVADRHEFFQKECFYTLLDILLKQCRLGCDAASGLEDDVDYEIISFRDSGDGVRDVLSVIYFITGSQMLDSMSNVMQNGGQDWETIEVCLFTLSVIARDIIQHTIGHSQGPQSADLTESFRKILQHSLPLMQINYATMKTGLLLIGNASKFIASRMDLPAIEQFMNCVVMSLQYPEILALSAGSAFCKMCIACRIELSAHPSAIESILKKLDAVTLVSKYDANVAMDKSPVETRLAIAEGVVRIVNHIRAPMSVGITDMLIQPIVTRLMILVNLTNPSEVAQSTEDVAAELQVLHVIVKYSNTGADDGTVAHVLSIALPMLQMVYSKPHLQEDTEVMEAFYALCSTAFTQDAKTMQPYMNDLISAAIAQFSRSWTPSCIQCVGKAVEACANEHGAMFENVLQNVAELLVRAHRQNHLVESIKMVETYFDTLVLFILFAPTTFQGNSAVMIMEYIAEVVSECLHQNIASSHAVSFLDTFVVKILRVFPVSMNAFEAVLRKHGNVFVSSAMVGLCDTVPNFIKLADTLVSLTQLYPGLMQEATYYALLHERRYFVSLNQQSMELFTKMVPYFSQIGYQNPYRVLAELCREEMSTREFDQILARIATTRFQA